MITFSANQTIIINVSNQTRTWLFSIGSYHWSTKVITFDSQAYTAKIIGKEWSGVTETASRGDMGYMAPSRITIPISNKDNVLDEDDFKTLGKFDTVNVKLILSGGGQEEAFREWVFSIDKVDDLNQKLIIHCEDYMTSLLEGVWPDTKQVATILPRVDADDYESLCIPKTFGTAYIPLGIIHDSTTTSTCPYWGNFYYCLGLTDTTYTLSEFRSPRDEPLSIYPTSGDTLTITDYCVQSTLTIDSVDYRVFQAVLASNSVCGDTYGEPGGGILGSPLVELYRADTLSMTNPASVTKYFLTDIGASAALISNTAFNTMAATYTTWGIEYNYGFYQPQEKAEVIASLLICCNSTIRQRNGQLCIDKFDRSVRTTLDDSDIKRTADAGPSTFKPQSGSTVEESDAGYMAFKETGMPQDELTKTIVIADGGTTYENLIDDTLGIPYIQNSIKARRIAELWLQRKFWPDKKFSFRTGYQNLFLEVDDVITISGSDYGGSHTVLIDSIQYDAKGVPTFTVCDMKSTLEDFSDSVPAGTTIDDATGAVSTWTPVFSGPDNRSGSNILPNIVYGKIRVQPTVASSNTIIMDADDPSIKVIEDGTERIVIGELATDEYGIQGNDSDGNELFKIDTSGANIAGWTIGTNSLESTSGDVGMSSHVTGSDDIRFWAGDATPASAEFRVYESGAMFATSATLAGTITANAGSIGGWNITTTTIQSTNSTGSITLDSSLTEIEVAAGSNYVKIDPDGIIGHDDILGDVFILPTNGDAPQFSSGVIKECTYELYTSGTIKTHSTPSTNGGFRIDNTGIQGWTSNGTNTFKTIVSGANAGDFSAGDYEGGNAGLFYDHSAGTLDLRGTLTIDSVPGLPSDEYLLGHFTFDEANVDFVSDKSVFANTGALQGTLPATSTKWIQSPRGLGYDVSTGNLLEVANGSGVEDIGNGSVSFSVWLKSNTTSPSHNEYIFRKYEDADNDIYVGYITSGYIRTRFYSDVVSSGNPVAYSVNHDDYDESNLYDQKWHHFVSICDFDNDTIYLYIDGIKVSDKAVSNSFPPDVSNTGNFRLSSASGYGFSGHLSDARVYSKALTANEVKALYTQPASYPADQTNTTLQQGTTITGGGITLSGGGVVKTVNKDSYDDVTPGVFLGYDSALGDYAFSAGDDTNYIEWDGTDLNIAGTLTVNSLPDLPPDNELLAYYGFDTVEVDYSIDKTKNENHAAIGGASPETAARWIQGPRGNALYTDINYLTVTDGPGIDDLGNGSFSFSVWAKSSFSSMPAAYEYFFYKNATVGTDQINFTFTGSGNAVFRSRLTENSVIYEENHDGFDPDNFYDNEWHHLVMVCDREAESFKMYVDGVLASDDAQSFSGCATDASTDGDLSIGASGTVNGFDGWMCDIRFYSIAITDQQAKALYTQPVSYPSDQTNSALQQGTTITGGGIVLSSGGALRSTGKTVLGSNSESGVYLGYDTSQYGISISDTATGSTNSYFNFGTTDGLEMQVGADDSININGTINMGPGSDIAMESIVDNQATITFAVSSTNNIIMTADHGDERLAIHPETDETCHFSIGYNRGGTEQMFEDIYVLGRDKARFGCQASSSRLAYLVLDSDTTTGATVIAQHDTTTGSQLYLKTGTSYFNCSTEISSVLNSSYWGKMVIDFPTATTSRVAFTADQVDYNDAYIKDAANVALTVTDQVTTLRIVRLAILDDGSDISCAMEDRWNGHTNLYTTQVNNITKGDDGTYYAFNSSNYYIDIKVAALGDTPIAILAVNAKGAYGVTNGIDVRGGEQQGFLRVLFYNGSTGSYWDISGASGTVYVNITYLGRPT